MKRVTGGVFLGVDLQSWGGTSFQWQTPEAPAPDGSTAFCIFEGSSDSFAPSTAPFMSNFRVDTLAALRSALKAEGCAVDEKTDSSQLGDFGWVVDPERNKIELWQPPAGRIEG